MTQKRWIVIGGVLLALVAAALGIMASALFHVPGFYEEAVAEVRDPVERREAAERFVQNTNRLADEIRHSARWSQSFTQRQINGWLAEELPRQYARHVPPGVSEPRVQFVEGAVLIGFKYQHKAYSTVVSVRLKPSVPEENTLAVEIESIRAGLVPISVQDVLEEITRRLDRQGWPVEWTESDGHDTAVVSLDRDGGQPAVLETVEVRDGLLRIGGSRRTLSTPSAERTAFLTPRRPVRVSLAN